MGQIVQTSRSRLERLVEKTQTDFLNTLLLSGGLTEESVDSLQRDIAGYHTPNSVTELCLLAIDSPDLLTTEAWGEDQMTPYSMLSEHIYQVLLADLRFLWDHYTEQHGEANAMARPHRG